VFDKSKINKHTIFNNVWTYQRFELVYIEGRGLPTPIIYKIAGLFMWYVSFIYAMKAYFEFQNTKNSSLRRFWTLYRNVQTENL
jgi:hypothetical protein